MTEIRDAHVHARDEDCCHPVESQPAKLAPRQIRFALKIEGLDCAEEVAVLRRAVGPLVGGEQFLQFDIFRAKMTVVANGTVVDPDRVRAAIGATGMTAWPWSEDLTDDDKVELRKQHQSGLTGASGTLLLLGFVTDFWTTWLDKASGIPSLPTDGSWQPATAAFVFSIAFASRYSVVKAWYALRSLRPDINLLMIVAIVGAVAINQWSEAATVAFLFALSVTIENWSLERARDAVQKLLDLSPPTVRLIDSAGDEKAVLAAGVVVGSQFVVRPGERVGLDGKISQGKTHINQAPITGESVPVFKEPGMEVFAGTINGDGAIVVESTRRAEDTTLAQVARLVGEAQGQRAPSEQWVETFARYYTPAVMLFAFLLALVPPLFDGLWSAWFYSSLVLLVIACPCALVISTPVSIVAALARAARSGVIIKGGLHVETPATARVVVFDKTGTLTIGEPRVVSITAFGRENDATVLARAAALESRSTHPIARAILREAESRRVPVVSADNLQTIQGRGITGKSNSEELWLGSHRFLEDRGLGSAPMSALAAAQASLGRTTVFVGNARDVLGLISVSDSIRPGASAAIAALKKAGVSRVVMLSGDNLPTANAVAREVGVDEVHAELLPADKLRFVRDLVSRFGPTMMVGDGVNDAPAMAGATLGVAMGAAGSDAAIAAADIALMADDIAKVPWLVLHSRRTLSIIRQNITFSLAVKFLVAALTVFGIASLWAAVAADVGASLLVTLNGLRLLQNVQA